VVVGAVLILIGVIWITDELEEARPDPRTAASWLLFDLLNYGRPFAGMIIAGGIGV
jgi:hypothetical protein